jgi:hypothetical protein
VLKKPNYLWEDNIMRKLSLLFALFVAAVSATSLVTPAFAQATRTWVSGVGDDANPCSRTAPCKTFAGAISKTATGGEINCLDPGGFGGVTITKSIAIICQTGTAGVLVSGTNAITVNAPAGAEILLYGLDMEGLANTSSAAGLNGVQIFSASIVTVQNCSIRNFSQNGINAAVAGARVMVLDSFIDSNNGGINIGAAGAAVTGIVMRTVLDLNPAFGVSVANTSTLRASASKFLGATNGVLIAAGGAFI